MSVLVSTKQSITNNLLNHSCSKQMYSFSKTPRFHSLKRCTSATFLYNIPNKMSSRKAYSGYGKKSDFTKGNPYNVGYYNISYNFSSPKLNAPKYTFGISRDFYKKVVINNKLPPGTSTTPGPNKYTYTKPFGSQAPKYTMLKRYPTPQFASKDSTYTPGPANYHNSLIINPHGKYTLSSFVNTPRSAWSLSKFDRFNYNYPKTPGANAYQLEEMINGKGKIYNSRYKSANAKTMSKRFRGPFDVTSITPGPGAYESFSEFGVYKDKHADEFDRSVDRKMNRTFFKNSFIKRYSRRTSRKHSKALSTGIPSRKHSKLFNSESQYHF